MRFSFKIGRAEQHLVEFLFDQVLTGYFVIKVDGAPVQRGLRLIGASPTTFWRFQVGQTEKLTVRIEKRKKLLAGGLLPQKYRVFVDDSLLMSIKGY